MNKNCVSKQKLNMFYGDYNLYRYCVFIMILQMVSLQYGVYRRSTDPVYKCATVIS